MSLNSNVLFIIFLLFLLFLCFFIIIFFCCAAIFYICFKGAFVGKNIKIYMRESLNASKRRHIFVTMSITIDQWRKSIGNFNVLKSFSSVSDASNSSNVFESLKSIFNRAFGFFSHGFKYLLFMLSPIIIFCLLLGLLLYLVYEFCSKGYIVCRAAVVKNYFKAKILKLIILFAYLFLLVW